MRNNPLLLFAIINIFSCITGRTVHNECIVMFIITVFAFYCALLVHCSRFTLDFAAVVVFDLCEPAPAGSGCARSAQFHILIVLIVRVANVQEVNSTRHNEGSCFQIELALRSCQKPTPCFATYGMHRSTAINCTCRVPVSCTSALLTTTRSYSKE